MTFTYLFFQKIRLLNSQGVFPLKLLKKISGSFYRCLIFKVRRTWVSPQRGSLLYHAVGCLSRGFFKLFSLLPKSSLLFVSLSCVSRRVPRYNTKFSPSCQPLFFTFFEVFSDLFLNCVLWPMFDTTCGSYIKKRNFRTIPKAPLKLYVIGKSGF